MMNLYHEAARASDQSSLLSNALDNKLEKSIKQYKNHADEITVIIFNRETTQFLGALK
ncbi:MAG: hypothetical protein WC825_05780 [Gallionellaceae bacterium]